MAGGVGVEVVPDRSIRSLSLSPQEDGSKLKKGFRGSARLGLERSGVDTGGCVGSWVRGDKVRRRR